MSGKVRMELCLWRVERGGSGGEVDVMGYDCGNLALELGAAKN